MVLSLFQNTLKRKQVLTSCCVRKRTILPYCVKKSDFTSLSSSKKNRNIKKSVFISQSNDIFSNLALEDWLYRNYDFTDCHVLLMWCNSPCVVIGRHQNPWLETNIFNSAKFGVKIARRNSGGGTVYHDEGNLNLTFFTPRKQYNRRFNLELISQALFKEYGISSMINSRDDIVVQEDFKISGTAAKLGQPNAYHHCTLLVNADKTVLSKVLNTNFKITTKATQSTRSRIINLCELNKEITVKQLSKAIGHEYLCSSLNTFSDYSDNKTINRLDFKYINPADKYFPGLDDIREEFSSWYWRFGRTPKFIVNESFPIPEMFGDLYRSDKSPLEIIFDVESGIIQNITINTPPSLLNLSVTKMFLDKYIKELLIGLKFTHETTKMLDNILNDRNTFDDGREFIVNCVKEILQQA